MDNETKFPIEAGNVPTRPFPFKLSLTTRLDVHTTEDQVQTSIEGRPPAHDHPRVRVVLDVNESANSHIVEFSGKVTARHFLDSSTSAQIKKHIQGGFMIKKIRSFVEELGGAHFSTVEIFFSAVVAAAAVCAEIGYFLYEKCLSPLYNGYVYTLYLLERDSSSIVLLSLLLVCRCVW